MPDPKPKEEQQTPAVEELQKALQEQKAQNEKYQQLIQNPTMQKVISKMAAGEEVKIAEKVAAPAPSMKKILGDKESDDEVNLDELSNKQLVGIISETVETYVEDQKGEAAKDYAKQIESMKSELLNTQQVILKMTAEQQVSNVASQHKDFETYRPAMQQLSQKYPAMEMEDLYKLAKSDHLMKVPPVNQLESEKTESSSPFPDWQPVHLRTAKSGEQEERVGQSTTALRNRTGGRKDFMALVDKAATSLLKRQNTGGP